MWKIEQAKSVSFSVYSMTEKTKFLGSCFPGSAETLARGGGITNHHLIAYSLSNISAKIPKSVNVRWSYSVLHHCRFFETRCTLQLFVIDNEMSFVVDFWRLSSKSLSMNNAKVKYYWKCNPPKKLELELYLTQTERTETKRNWS